MNNTKYTPGPWYSHRHSPRDLWKVHANETNVVASVFGTTIKCDANSAEQQEANARLISTAPEMLAMLQSILADMDRGHSINPYEHRANVAQVIAKAIG